MMGSLILRVTLAQAWGGYWDGGPKRVFDWRVDCNFSDGRSRVGSWAANLYFEVATGKTERQTLGNARRHFRMTTNIPMDFEYIEA